MAKDRLRWQKLGSEPGPDIPLFGVRYDRLQHPESKQEFQRLVLEAPDWVNVIATTEDERLVMVEQYRFGVEDITLEPVGGIVDAGESSQMAAERELLEETGYGGGNWQYLGAVQANPAVQNNLCHLWRADGVRRLQDQDLDPGEAIKVHLMSLEDVKAAIDDGRFLHPLGHAALTRVYPIW